MTPAAAATGTQRPGLTVVTSARAAAPDVYVADAGRGRVVEVRPGGRQVVVASGLSSPAGLAVDAAGDVYVADAGRGRVVEVRPGGRQVVVASGLSSPAGLAVDAAGDVYVADAGRGRVVEVRPGGRQVVVASGLSSPAGLAIDTASDLYVADPGQGTIVAVDRAGQEHAFIVPGLRRPGVLATDAAGDLFVSGASGRVLDELTPDGNWHIDGRLPAHARYLATGPSGQLLASYPGATAAVWAPRHNADRPDAARRAWTPVGTGLSEPAGIAFGPPGPGIGYQQQRITFTAEALGGIGRPAPTGTLTFSDGSTVLGSAPLHLDGSGVDTAAIVTGQGLTPGIDNITVTYSGDGTYRRARATTALDVLRAPVNIAGTAPKITSPASATFKTGTAGSFTVKATGSPTPTLTESGTLPAGVTFTAHTNGTATLAGTPGKATGGSYALTFTASNGVTPKAVQKFTLTVDQAPAITSAAAKTFTAGAAGTFTVKATGYPAPALSETGALPSGVTFTDNHNGTATLAGTTTVTGTFPLTITASNGIGTAATQAFTLTVNGAPAITSPSSATFTTGTAGSFTVTSIGSPTPTLTETGTLPAGVKFTANSNGTATLTGTPGKAAGGSYALTFTASNGVGKNAVQNFTLTVNQAPAIPSAAAKTFTEGTAGTFTVKATGYPAPALSENGALPSGVTFTDNHNGTATLAGTATATGTFPITITASNGIGTAATQAFTLTVNAAPKITSAGAATFSVSTAGSFTVTATGFPTPALTETGTLPAGVAFTDNHNGTATLSGTPSATAGGLYTLTINASNGVGTAATQTFQLSVDQSPAITSANAAAFTTGTAESFTVTTTGYPDPALSENGALPSGVTFTDNHNGTATLAGSATAPGKFPITITASNGIGSAATQSFTLTTGGTSACTISWTGATSTAWGTAGNWSPARVPGATDWVCIPLGAAHVPPVLAGTATILGFTSDPGLKITGTLQVTDTSVTSTSAGPVTLSGTLEGAGNVTFSGPVTASGSIAGPGTVTVASGATMTMQGANVTGSLVNQGTVSVPSNQQFTVGTGGTFSNQGSFTAASGSYVYGGCAIPPGPGQPGTPAGTWNNAGQVTINATSGFPVTFDEGNYCLVFNDSGTVSITGGTLMLGAVATINSGGSVAGPGTLEIDNTLTVNPNLTLALPVTLAGTLEGSGNVTFTGAVTGSGTIAGTATVASGATLSSTSLDVSGSLTNQGAMSIPNGDSLYIDTGGTFSNQSSFTAGAGSFVDGGCAIPPGPGQPGTPAGTWNNAGQVTISATSGFPVTFDEGNYCLVFNDSGTVSITGGTLMLGAVATINSGGSIAGRGTLEIDNTLTVNPNLTLALPVSLFGTLEGPGTVTFTGAVTGSGAIAGTATVASGATLSSTSLNVSGTLTNQGAMSIPNGDSLYIDTGGTFNNQSSFTAGPGTDVDAGCAIPPGPGQPGTPAGTWNNSGPVTVNASSGFPVVFGEEFECLVFNDSGPVSITGGILQSWGTDTINSGGSIAGPGTLEIDNSLTVNPNLTLGLPVSLYGTLEGPGNVTFTGAVTTSGTIAGTATVASGATLSSASLDVSGSLTNQGNFTIPAGDSLYIDTGGTFNNQSSFTAGPGTDVDAGCAIPPGPGQPGTPAGTWNNSGPVTVNASSGFPVVFGEEFECLVFNDSGPVSITGGILQSWGTDTINSGGSIAGPGTLEIDNSLTVNPNLTLGLPVSLYGTLEGPGNVTFTGAVTTSGTIAGTATVASGATLSSASLDVSGSLTNQGNFTIPAGDSLYIDTGGTFNNQSSFTAGPGTDVDAGCAIPPGPGQPGTPAGTWNNSGPVTVNASSGFPVVFGEEFECLVFNDSGPVSITGGTLQTWGTDTFNSGASVTGSGTLEIDNTVIANTGLSTGPVTLNGSLEIAPGVVVHVSSLPSPDGTLELDGNGGFGQLRAGGVANVSSMSLDFTSSSYSPTCGSSVAALTAGGVSGTFDDIEGGNLPSNGSWQATSSGTAADATVYCTPPAVPPGQTYGTGGSDDSVNPSGYYAEPVDTGTGAYSTTETDASLTGIGVPFSFVRSYTSANTYSGPLGPGWTDSMNVFLSGSTQSDVTLYSEDGQQTTFTGAGNGTYSSPPGTRSVLTDASGGGWLLVRQNQDHLVFNAAGQLTAETDRNGIGLSLSYNTSGQLASVTDYAGRTVTFSYNSSGLLAQMNFPPGRSVTYGYNTAGDLNSVTDAAGGVTKYTYNTAGLLTTVTDQNAHQVVANTYNSAGRVISQINALGKKATFSWNASTQTCTYTDPNGNKWQDVYSGGALIERIDPLGDTTSYSYDSNLDLAAVTDPDGNTTTMTYDGNGNMLTKTAPSPISTTQSWTYDAKNDVTAYTDADQNTTAYSYDANGNLIKETLPDQSTITWTRNATTGLPTAMTNQRGNTTNYGYNTAGELISVTSALGEQTTYGYDSAGRMTSMTTPRGNVAGGNPAAYTTSYSYDPLDELTSVTNPDGDTVSYTYDAVGNKLSMTDPDSNMTKYGYDAENRLTTVTAPGPAVTSYAYDAVGNKISMTDPDGYTTAYGYNKANRLATVTSQLGQITSYSYDATGNQTSITDANGAVTTKAYNVENRPISVGYSDGTPTVSYAYDADGNRTKMTDGTGTTNYTYNSRDELTGVSGPEGSYGYTYDGTGDVTSRGYPDGSTASYGYDKDNRLAAVTADGSTTTYAYNPDSELASVAYPNGYTETSSYDAAGRLSSIADQRGASALTSFAYTYDQGGNPTQVVTPTETDTYTYDARNWLTGACYGTSCANGSISYTYDLDGNRTGLTTATGSTSYTYNKADELASVTNSSGTITPAYDADGHLTSYGSASYAWNAVGQLTSVTAAGTTTSYGYDGDGNRVSATSGGSTTTYSYDVNNQLPLLASESSGSELRRYVWGGSLLLSMRTGGADYYVAHDEQGSVMTLTSASGATESLYTYNPFGDPRTTTNVDPNAPAMPLRFESQYLDPTGLYQLRARSMNPVTGTFLSPDPVPPPATSPAISPYLYAADQPGVLEDLSGLSLWGDIKSSATHAFAVAIAGPVAGVVDEVTSGVQDVYGIATCGAWYSGACEIAYQKAGVDAAVDLVSLLCKGTLILAATCSAAVSAGGAWALDTWGYKMPATSSSTTGDDRSGYYPTK